MPLLNKGIDRLTRTRTHSGAGSCPKGDKLVFDQNAAGIFVSLYSLCPVACCHSSSQTFKILYTTSGSSVSTACFLSTYKSRYDQGPLPKIARLPSMIAIAVYNCPTCSFDCLKPVYRLPCLRENARSPYFPEAKQLSADGPEHHVAPHLPSQ